MGSGNKVVKPGRGKDGVGDHQEGQAPAELPPDTEIRGCSWVLVLWDGPSESILHVVLPCPPSLTSASPSLIRPSRACVLKHGPHRTSQGGHFKASTLK